MFEEFFSSTIWQPLFQVLTDISYFLWQHPMGRMGIVVLLISILLGESSRFLIGLFITSSVSNIQKKKILHHKGILVSFFFCPYVSLVYKTFSEGITNILQYSFLLYAFACPLIHFLLIYSIKISINFFNIYLNKLYLKHKFKK